MRLVKTNHIYEKLIGLKGYIWDIIYALLALFSVMAIMIYIYPIDTLFARKPKIRRLHL